MLRELLERLLGLIFLKKGEKKGKKFPFGIFLPGISRAKKVPAMENPPGSFSRREIWDAAPGEPPGAPNWERLGALGRGRGWIQGKLPALLSLPKKQRSLFGITSCPKLTARGGIWGGKKFQRESRKRRKGEKFGMAPEPGREEFPGKGDFWGGICNSREVLSLGWEKGIPGAQLFLLPMIPTSGMWECGNSHS